MKEMDIILEQGVHGDIDTFFAWYNMFCLFQKTEVSPSVAEFLPKEKSLPISSNWTREDFEDYFATQIEKKIITKVDPYNEYRLLDFAKIFDEKIIEGFLSNRLEFEPIQFIRSRLQNFLTFYKVKQHEIEELVIATTEATENAVKYSNGEFFYYQMFIRNNIFHMKIINRLVDKSLTQKELNEKLREDASLMRGMLVMANLLDSLDIAHNENKKRVELTGSKELDLS